MRNRIYYFLTSITIWFDNRTAAMYVKQGKSIPQEIITRRENIARCRRRY